MERAGQDDGTGTTLLPGVGGSGARAHGVNGDGEVAGTSYTRQGPRATMWREGRAEEVLPGRHSFGLAVNSQGDMAGAALDGAGRLTAFIRTGQEARLLDNPAGLTWSTAYGLNDEGEAAVTGLTGRGRFRAFRYSEQDGWAALGTLGGQDSYATAINGMGHVAGHSTTRGGQMHAFVADNNGMRDLGTLGGVASFAYSINAHGEVVGHFLAAGGLGERAFVWRGGRMWDLNELVQPHTGWALRRGVGINDRGQIAGVGEWNGEERGFLLEPVPEPGTMGLGVLGVGLMVAWRRRRAGAR